MDDRCTAGRLAGCPVANEQCRIGRLGAEDWRIERVATENGYCMLVPIAPDGTRGVGMRCTEADAWQAGKFHFLDARSR